MREEALAILNYEDYSTFPIVHFGYWHETLIKWANEGHISMDLAKSWSDNTPVDRTISDKLGFDFNWFNTFPTNYNLLSPPFEQKVMKVHEDGSREFLDSDGVVVLQKDEAGSIPSEIAHTLTDRKSWEEHYKPRLAFSEDRITKGTVNTGAEFITFDQGGLDFLKDTENRQYPLGLMVGSLLGKIRNWLGVVGMSYLKIDDPELMDEIVETVGNLCYEQAEYTLKKGAKFDFGHYWEDICFKNGPLVEPGWFAEKVGPHYKRISDLLNSYGVNIISLDCDGLIDSLVPIWLENGVNTMFPMEVGTWNASIAPWREKYGKEVRGVGGMNKVVFSRDRKAVDEEIERLKPLVELGGYIPCPDHRIAPDAEWDNVRYYCEKLRAELS